MMNDLSAACLRCHTTAKPGARFCSKCGAKMTPPPSPRAQTAQPSHGSGQRVGGQTPQGTSIQTSSNRKFCLWVLGLLLLSQVWMLVHRLASRPPVGLGAYDHTLGGVFRYYLDCYPILYVFLIAFFLGLFVMVSRTAPRE